MIDMNRPKFQPGMVNFSHARIKENNDFLTLKLVVKNIISLLDENNILQNSPFNWINFVYRYGENNMLSKPEVGVINKKYGDLSVTVEIDADWIEYASFNDQAMLEQIFEAAALEALIYVGKKYTLPIDVLEKRLKEIGGFPELPEGYKGKLPPNPRRIPREGLKIEK